MQSVPRTATNIIVALTAVAWVIAVLLGQSEKAAFALGFIPLRVTVPSVPWAAVPAFLMPLTATLVHSGLVHLGFNLLMLVWCGTAVERILGKAGVIILYLVGAYAAAAAQWALDPGGTAPMVGVSGAISAAMGAFALSFGRAKPLTSNLRLNRWLNVGWLLSKFEEAGMRSSFAIDAFELARELGVTGSDVAEAGTPGSARIPSARCAARLSTITTPSSAFKSSCSSFLTVRPSSSNWLGLAPLPTSWRTLDASFCEVARATLSQYEPNSASSAAMARNRMNERI